VNYSLRGVDIEPRTAEWSKQYSDEIAANTARLTDCTRSYAPLLLIWGKSDPYLHVTVAEYMRSQARNDAIHVLEAGHWPQIDELLMSLGLCLQASDCEDA
jgi:pimeloyl-ACP methyl ester carboxylesterase